MNNLKKETIARYRIIIKLKRDGKKMEIFIKNTPFISGVFSGVFTGFLGAVYNAFCHN